MYPYLYAYATDRGDGFAVAVGIIRLEGQRADGGLALFQNAEEAHLFGIAYVAAHGGHFIDLPSAERLANGTWREAK